MGSTPRKGEQIMYKTKLQLNSNEDMEIEITVKKKTDSSADQPEPTADSTSDASSLLSVEETWQWLKNHYGDKHFDALFGMDTCIYEIMKTFEEVRQMISKYEAERKEEKEAAFYNGKVFCLDNECYDYTTGKIYQFEDGAVTNDVGLIMPTDKKIHSFEEWANWSNAKWMEVVE